MSKIGCGQSNGVADHAEWRFRSTKAPKRNKDHHFFAHNSAALALHERAGYETTGLFMAKNFSKQG